MDLVFIYVRFVIFCGVGFRIFLCGMNCGLYA